MNPLILRIVFRSGRVAEERGTELSIAALFARDEDRLIDHIMMIDLVTGEVAIYAEENDERFDGMDVVFSNEAVKWNRRS